MGWGYGNGGGGAGLNFKVVGGTTMPANPSGNTIWVNTSTTITSYVFRPTQPTGSAGMVWIRTGTTNDVSFNALKKNSVIIFPQGAMQYVSGAWTYKTTKIYQSGAWKDLARAGYLYYDGYQCVSTTGGWTGSGYSANGVSAVAATFNANNMYFAGGNSNISVAGTVKAVSLSNYTRIGIKGKVSSVYNNAHGLELVVSSNKNTDNQSAVLKLNTVGAFTKYLNISSLAGNYYVSVRAASNPACEGTVTEVWME